MPHAPSLRLNPPSAAAAEADSWEETHLAGDELQEHLQLPAPSPGTSHPAAHVPSSPERSVRSNVPGGRRRAQHLRERGAAADHATSNGVMSVRSTQGQDEAGAVPNVFPGDDVTHGSSADSSSRAGNAPDADGSAHATRSPLPVAAAAAAVLTNLRCLLWPGIPGRLREWMAHRCPRVLVNPAPNSPALLRLRNQVRP